MTAKKVSHLECGMERMQSLPTRIPLSICRSIWSQLMLYSLVLDRSTGKRASAADSVCRSVEILRVSDTMHRDTNALGFMVLLYLVRT